MCHLVKLAAGALVGAGSYLLLTRTNAGRALSDQVKQAVVSFSETVQEGYRTRTEELRRAIEDTH